MTRAIAFDTTAGSLSLAYALHARLALLLRRVDLVLPVGSWSELEVALVGRRGISELSIVGHGRAGSPEIAGRPLDTASAERLCTALRPALAHGAVVWLRSCSVAATASGETFLRLLSDRAGCDVYAHLDEIGPWQGGLVVARPVRALSWVRREVPRRWWQLPRGRWVTCLRMRAPARA